MEKQNKHLPFTHLSPKHNKFNVSNKDCSLWRTHRIWR